MIKKTFQITLAAAFVLSACVSIPDNHLAVSQRGDNNIIHHAGDCDNVLLESEPAHKKQHVRRAV